MRVGLLLHSFQMLGTKLEHPLLRTVRIVDHHYLNRLRLARLVLFEFSKPDRAAPLATEPTVEDVRCRGIPGFHLIQVHPGPRHVRRSFFRLCSRYCSRTQKKKATQSPTVTKAINQPG